MKSKRSIKIISIVLIFMLICVSITYVKSGNKEVLATTKEFNSENLQDNEHMHVEVDSSGDKVPVPNGYVGSKVSGENEIDTGYVIYEGEDEVNDSNVEEAQKTRNQYVWIPVPDASTMYGTDANGKKWGKLYEFTTSTGANIDSVTGAKPLNWSESDGVMKVGKSQYREPDIIPMERSKNSAYDMDSTIKTTKVNEKTTHQFIIQLEQEFNNMIKSVEMYGGFYVGRYETGDLNQKVAKVTRENNNIANQNWYTIYNKSKTLKGNNKNIETGMIWGNQWDRTLNYIIESGNKTKEDLCNSPTSWGNYKNSVFEYINNNGSLSIKNKGDNIRIPTGSTEFTKACNIYDLLGNVREFTMTATNSFSRTMLGGGCYDNGFGRIIAFPNGLGSVDSR